MGKCHVLSHIHTHTTHTHTHTHTHPLFHSQRHLHIDMHTKRSEIHARIQEDQCLLLCREGGPSKLVCIQKQQGDKTGFPTLLFQYQHYECFFVVVFLNNNIDTLKQEIFLLATQIWFWLQKTTDQNEKQKIFTYYITHCDSYFLPTKMIVFFFR